MDAVGRGWKSAEVLVHRSEDGKLEINEAALDHLSSIRSPVHVISVVGPYRAGKSYLLNSVIRKLTGKENVFDVGETIQASTKGISIWCCSHPYNAGHWLVFIDTEGLDDVEKGDRGNDMLIFILAVLLSSTLIYNSRGVIDFNAIERIHHVSRLAERIRLMNEGNDEIDDIGFDLAFPEFIWVVRDFQLILEQDGKQIEDNEYLENALTTLNPNPTTAMSTSIKRCIKEYFPERECFLLPHLHQLERKAVANGVGDRSDRFVALVERILQGKYKMHEGSEVTGHVFGRLAQELVTALQKGPQAQLDIPVIMNTIAEKENATAIAKSIDVYREQIGQETAEPVDMVMLHQIHMRCSDAATAAFMQMAVYPIDSSFHTLMEYIKEEFNHLCANNAARLNGFYEETYNALRREFIGVNNDKYFCLGGYQLYREDMTKLRKRWEEIPVTQGRQGHEFLMDKFKRLQEEEATMIMNADRELTALRREEEAKRMEEERKKLMERKEFEERTAKETMEKVNHEFEENVSKKVKSAILRPDEMEVSKLNCRISVLERELEDLRQKRVTEEEESHKQRLKIYREKLAEKQKQSSKWQKVSTSIQTFATGAFDCICKLLTEVGKGATAAAVGSALPMRAAYHVVPPAYSTVNAPMNAACPVCPPVYSTVNEPMNAVYPAGPPATMNAPMNGAYPAGSVMSQYPPYNPGR